MAFSDNKHEGVYCTYRFIVIVLKLYTSLRDKCMRVLISVVFIQYALSRRFR